MQPKTASTLLKIATPSIASLLASSAMGTVHVGSGEDAIDMLLLDPANPDNSVQQYWTVDGASTPELSVMGSWYSYSDSYSGTQYVRGGGVVSFNGFGLSFATQRGALQLLSENRTISSGLNWTTLAANYGSAFVFNPYSVALVSFRNERANEMAANAFGSNNGSAFIGFRFDNGGTYNYGWAEMTWSNDGEKIHLTIGPSTWADTGAILAGTTTEVVPEPAEAAAGLGALALGAVGLARWRRNRAAKVA